MKGFALMIVDFSDMARTLSVAGLVRDAGMMCGEHRRQEAIPSCVSSVAWVSERHPLRRMKVSGLVKIEHLRLLICAASKLVQIRTLVGVCHDGGAVVRRESVHGPVLGVVLNRVSPA